MQHGSTTPEGTPEKILYRNGSVHTPADPFATALLVENGRIAWVGEEGGADSLADAAVREVDLDGLVLTPGFAGLADQAPAADGWAELLRAGRTGIVVAEGEDLVLHAPSGEAGRRPQASAALVTAPYSLEGLTTHQLVLEAAAGTTEWIHAAKQALGRGDVLALLRRTDETGGADAASENPWQVCLDGLFSVPSEEALAVRATVHAQTRAVHRIFDTGGPLSGQLAPGSPATFVGWRAESLMVQTADSRIAAWSTDPRARTPLLPALDPEGSLPQAELVVLDGRIVPGVAPDTVPE